MKLAIIVEDKAVYIDGVMRASSDPKPLDLSNCGIPENVWALQWKDVAGFIEFNDNPDGSKPPNETITVLPQWAENCIAVYNAWQPAPPPIVEQPNTTGTQPA